MSDIYVYSLVERVVSGGRVRSAAWREVSMVSARSLDRAGILRDEDGLGQRRRVVDYAEGILVCILRTP